MAHPLQFTPSHQRRKREREKKKKKKPRIRSKWVASDRRWTMGGWLQLGVAMCRRGAWVAVDARGQSWLAGQVRSSWIVGQIGLSSTLLPLHQAVDYTNETQKSLASPPHALPLDQAHFSPFVVTKNGGIDWISGFYLSGFLDFIFLRFLGFNFLVFGFYFSGFLGFILWVDWVGLNVMVVGLWQSGGGWVVLFQP